MSSVYGVRRSGFSRKLKGMERICSQCHAEIDAGSQADWCPACGGAIVSRPSLPQENPPRAAAEVDRRGIVLPRRHAVGGIITPQ